MSTQARQNPELPWYTICIALYSRGDGTFHWAIVVPLDSYVAAKFHATNRGSYENGWAPFRLKTMDETLATSQNACVVLKIGESTINQGNSLNMCLPCFEGNLGEQTIDSLNAIFRDVPMENIPSEANEPFSPMTWVRQAVRALHRRGIINCPDARKVEEEVIRYATANDEGVVMGMAGFTIHESAYSS